MALQLFIWNGYRGAARCGFIGMRCERIHREWDWRCDISLVVSMVPKLLAQAGVNVNSTQSRYNAPPD